MTLARSAAEVLNEHIQFELECIDRLYLNLYVPRLQRADGCGYFFKYHRGNPNPSGALMGPMSRAFVQKIESFAKREGVPIIRFKKNEIKHEVVARDFEKFDRKEGVVVIGKAQERAQVTRTIRRVSRHTGKTYPWLISSTALVNHYYFYCLDRNFGPMFVKFCSYFPYNGKVWCNGHEYLKRQLDQRGIGYEALDNGLLSCEDPETAQRICDDLSPRKIQGLVRKWLRRLPHPFTRQDREANYKHDISILQAEFSCTQVLDRPLHGRIFFEQLIRDNLDLGRPDRVQLVFHRRINKKTPGRFRTRIITDGVTPSLYINYKRTRLKQYFKLCRALRTETTIQNTYDHGIGRRLKNLTALREVGFSANRRVLHVQKISHDPTIGETAFQALLHPVTVLQQRASALRFGDPRVMALFWALVLFRLLPEGFANRDLRKEVAALLHLPVEKLSPGRMTYDLRRLRLHGLIQRIPKSHRYRVTDQGFRSALFLLRSYATLLRPGLSVALGKHPPAPLPLRKAFDQLDRAIERNWRCQDIAA